MMNVNKDVSEHFKEFIFDWNYKYYFLMGGYGSSKSYSVALKIVLKLLQERRTCLVVREVYATMRESCFSLLREIISSLDLEYLVEFHLSPMQVTFANGSRMIFRGMDRPQKLKSIHDISLIWLEECSEISYAGFKELIGRLRHPTLQLYMLMSTNPVSKSNWTYKHFFENKQVDDAELYARRVLKVGNIYYHHSTADDNKFLPEDYVNQLDDIKNYDADLYRVARLGQFGVNGVKVLPNFEIMPHMEILSAIKKIPRRYYYAGMDFGFVVSYNAVVRVAVDDVNKFLYIYQEWYEKGLTDDEIVQRLHDFKDSRELIVCDSAEPKTIKYLQKHGINAVGCKKFAGSVLYNIRKLRRFKKIICSDNCPHCIEELADLTFKVDKNGNVSEDEFNIDAHTFDAIAYGLNDYDFASLKISKSDLGL